jgi:GTP-binding protein EngB required for normal cell division
MASKDPNMCKQVSAGKTKHVTLTILQEIYVIGRLNSGKSQREVMASHIRLSTI